MKILRYTILYFLLYAPMRSLCQLSETDTMRFDLTSSLTGSLSTGNVQRTLLVSGLEVLASSSTRTWVFKAQNSYRYGTARKSITENDLFGTNYVYHKPFKKVYQYFMAVYQNSLMRQIDHRISFGPGLTFVLLKRRTSIFKLSFTCIADRTIYKFTPDVDNGFPTKVETIRPTLRLYEWHNIHKHLFVFYEFIDQISVSTYGGHRIMFVAGLDVKLFEHSSFVSRFNYTHEDLSRRGVKHDDSFLTFGFNMKL